ncbi:thiamine phosphate synthase [Acidimangrovimonas sediminis]|uniref:thiamine phosphate synthase n=1 Tax=Acidimangrovimonas sediminis TaxID=2056283 RepID=UPI000C7F7EA9|nr:thiamine phosphate synthase [Acidimangrovimonas sediminis]
MLDPFYLITATAARLERLVPQGVRLVQLRAKDLSPDALRAEAIRAQACCARHGAQLILNDHWELALDLGIDFVHLGQEDLDRADLAALKRAGVRYGLSTHDHAELDRALACAPAYIALGPIYPTLLKKMKWAEQGLARVTEWRRLAGSVPLVAIGGLTPDRVAGVLAAGADSAAVVTDIQQAADPAARCREWLAVTAATSAAAGRGAP